MIKNRHLVQILIAFLLGSAGATFFDVPALFLLALFLVSLSALTVFLIVKNKKRIEAKNCFIVFLIFILITGYSLSYIHCAIRFDRNIPKDNILVEAYICNKTSDYTEIKTISDNIKSETKIRIYNLKCNDENAPLAPFYTGKFNIRLSECPNYIKALGVSFYATGSVSELRPTEGHFFSKSIYEVKSYFTDKVSGSFPESEKTATFINALIFGETSDIPDNIYASYGRLGITHIISVSGLHFTIIVISLFNILKFFRVGLKTRSLVCIPFAILYCLLSGASVSSVRAMIMIIVYLLGRFVLYQTDSLTSLSIAATIICILNPYSIYSLGFVLSFIATFAIFIAPSFLNVNYSQRKCKVVKILNNIVQSVFITLIISMMLSPILFERFQILSLFTPIANLLLSAVFTPIMLICVLGAVISVFTMPKFAEIAISFIIESLHEIIENIASIHNCAIIPDVKIINIFIVLSVVCVISALLLKKKLRDMVIRITVISFVAITFIYVLIVNKNIDETNKIYLSEDASSALIISEGEIYLLAENESALSVEFLKSNNILDISSLILFDVESEEKAVRYLSDFLSTCKAENIYTNHNIHLERTDILSLEEFEAENLSISHDGGLNILFSKSENIVVMGNKADKTNKEVYADKVVVSGSFFENIRNFLSLPRNIKEIYIPYKYRNSNNVFYIKRNYPKAKISYISDFEFYVPK